MAATRRIRHLRAALLGLLLALVGGLVLLYWFGRVGSGQAVLPRPTGIGEEDPPEEAAVVGSGFDYTFAEKGVTVFHLRGESYRAQRSGRIQIEGMGLTLYAEDGSSYEVESDRAELDEDSEDASFDGNVRVHGPRDLILTTARLELKEKGTLLLGNEPLSFAYGTIATGRADGLRANLEDKDYLLYGNVRADSLPTAEAPFSLSTDRLYFNRDAHHARADGDVALTWAGNRLEALRLNLALTDDNRQIRYLRALYDVAGTLLLTDPEGSFSPVDFSGKDLRTRFDDDGGAPRRFHLEGEQGRPVELVSGGGEAPGPRRDLTANYIEGELSQGVIASAEAFGRVTIVESAGGVVRRATGERAEAEFGPDGAMVRVSLFDWVVYRAPDLTARGHRARFDFSEGSGEFFGEPAEINSDQGDLTAPHVLYTRELGLLHGEGGTRALLRGSPGDGGAIGGPLAHGEGPVWVEAQEAFLRDVPRSFLFRGGVKAWRGEDVILAGELRGEEEGNELHAAGGVRTLWRLAATDGAAGEEPGGDTGNPIEVTSQRMRYSGADGLLVYVEDVQAVEEGRTLACDELTVELTSERRAEELLCRGHARIEDTAAGRTIEGDTALYKVAERTVDVSGEAVKMTDRAGGEVTGRRLIYDLEADLVRVASGTDAPAAAAEPEPEAPDAAPTGDPPGAGQPPEDGAR